MSTFFRLFTYVRRTVQRARLRSLLTILGTALAIALFTFVRMLEGGVDRMKEQANPDSSIEVHFPVLVNHERLHA